MTIENSEDIQMNENEFTLAYASGEPLSTCLFKDQNEDFFVDEIMEVELTGRGEHLWIYFEKSGQNTHWVCDRIGDALGISSRNISHSGLKDRYGVTRQWISLPWPIKSDLPTLPEIEGVKILKMVPHERKLNIGTHKKNYFKILLREIDANPLEIIQRLEKIKEQGFPNYFGHQRFGIEGKNIQRAKDWFANKFRPKKNLQSMLLSSASSHLFNLNLAKRIQEGNWLHVQSEEILMLNNSHSWFNAQGEDINELQSRLDQGELNTTGPLWGKGDVLNFEQFLRESEPTLTEGLEKQGLKMRRRSLRIFAEDMKWLFKSEGLELEFYLESGAYATTLLRELFELKEPERQN